MKNYQNKKETARQKCINIFNENCEKQLAYSEVISQGVYFSNIAKRNGLTKEFRENGLI